MLKDILQISLKLKAEFHGLMLLIIEQVTGTFYENELQKINQQEFRIEKVINRKGDKLYVKWKGYDNSFNSWIDKKDLV